VGAVSKCFEIRTTCNGAGKKPRQDPDRRAGATNIRFEMYSPALAKEMSHLIVH
jgi:hypothetical protein